MDTVISIVITTVYRTPTGSCSHKNRDSAVRINPHAKEEKMTNHWIKRDQGTNMAGNHRTVPNYLTYETGSIA
ncbi:MAG: hypothetical protein J07HQW2_03468 [Haloquadratum walsbyi J07HQW2]|uniref:Uncharacterized protein n=1 Tax=Haloquadratum walsbyi J07HQW2 TaxID=1238425 RepID=U1PT67_9EURY|nr:MAG: hypothetical protein J07HQW2_03468 [Haloquadratum walsbyi J07HQW2]